MTVGLYRLTTLSEGTVIASNDGVVFDTFDANGEPMKVSFKKDSSESFTLKIEESTWPFLESGTVFEKADRDCKKIKALFFFNIDFILI